MIRKILIANRGEIACRIIRTARTMDITSVAVYSDADRNSLHVRMADEAYYIGPSPAVESYLNIENILQVAEKSGVQAIHPGYGFLAENPEFAKACETVGLTFIGPSPKVITEMGIKSLAKDRMEKAGIPIIPGYHGDSQDTIALNREAMRIGFPLLIKADRGGGGKGIRLVTSISDFDSSIEAARREAGSSFGNSTIIIEKYLVAARHVEVQIFRDTHDNGVHLFERDCSIQRRHQKIIEEAPAPGIEEELRHDLCSTALKAAEAVGYVGAGTVEFLVDSEGDFYFMEINTRLQVEHPVTEMITGQDLVTWQIQVANGEKLPVNQKDLEIQGHAIEARIYAENCDHDFLPSTGIISHLREPMENKAVRVDSGIQEGDKVSLHYDPILAKLIVWGESREAAIELLQKSLREYQLSGITSNIGFLHAVAGSQEFITGSYDVTFVENNLQELTVSIRADVNTMVLACLYILLTDKQRAKENVINSDEHFSPWNCRDGYRINGPGRREIVLSQNGSERRIQASRLNDEYVLDLPEVKLAIRGCITPQGRVVGWLSGQRLEADVVQQEDNLTVFHMGKSITFTLDSDDYATDTHHSHNATLLSPMPGLVTAVFTSPGTRLAKGEPILVLEAMKMEYTVTAPEDGIVEEILFKPGDSVGEGERLIIFENDTVQN